ncbi:MAG: tetratricopeptide repeat protein [Prevotella sp.]
MGFFKQLFGGGDDNHPQNQEQQKEHDFDVLKYDGIRAISIGQLDYAIKCLTKALEIKEDLESRDYLSQVYMRTDQMDLALEQLAKLREAQPDNVRILLRIANIYYMNEDYDKMAETCEAAGKLDADNPHVVFDTARAMRGKGDMIQAVAQITRCISLCEKAGDEEEQLLKDATLVRGGMLLKMGDKKGAAVDADWLVEHDAESEDAMLFKAQVEQVQGNNEEALKYFDKVVELNPFSVEAFRQRGGLKLAMGDKTGAEEDMKIVLELDPKEAEAVDGKFEAEGHEDIQQQVEQSYKNVNPFA